MGASTGLAIGKVSTEAFDANEAAFLLKLLAFNRWRSVRRSSQVLARSRQDSHPVKNEAFAERTGDARQVFGVAREHDVFANQRANHHRCVHDVGSPRSGTRRSRRSARRLGQNLEAAPRQET
jgi:hypothetical protein